MGSFSVCSKSCCYFVLLALFVAGPLAAAQEPDSLIAILGADPNPSPDGWVSAWTGGLPLVSLTEQGHHQDPFREDRVIDVINTRNLAEYDRYVSEGLKALMNAYPDTFKVPLYPSRRSVSYPGWYYENTGKKPDTSLKRDGSAVNGAYPGVLFPEPANGLEAIWNHLTRWRGRYFEREYVDAIVYSSGEKKLTRSKQEVSFELFRSLDPSPRDIERQVLVYYLSRIMAPSSRAGGALLAIDYLDQARNPRKAWSYDVGQKRVKRLPHVMHDNSALMTESLQTADDTDMFSGTPDRYSWNLLGKEVLFVPYNNYRASDPSVSYDALFTAHHLNPEYTRYEAHRVWVVEAILNIGSVHVYPKRRFYIDEDSWQILMADQYDSDGNLWRVKLCYMKTFYEVPLSFCAAEVVHDLKEKSYFASGLTNEERNVGVFDLEPPPVSKFSPAALRSGAKR